MIIKIFLKNWSAAENVQGDHVRNVNLRLNEKPSHSCVKNGQLRRSPFLRVDLKGNCDSNNKKLKTLKFKNGGKIPHGQTVHGEVNCNCVTQWPKEFFFHVMQTT
jgi:hypothetical protein